jgi:hypothetical protein
MTRRATLLLFAASLLGSLFLAGCACCAQPKPKPEPGDAAVVIDVQAKPKAGAKAEHFTRVPVYDAAPHPVKPTGQFEHVNYDDLGDIVVWLEPTGDTSHAETPSEGKSVGQVDVRAGKPADHVHVASVGQPVAIHNAGSETVKLYSVADGNDFELPPLEPGAVTSIEPKSEGLIEVLADPSQPPVATIYAAPSKFVARARSGKTIVFNDVPPGSYQAVAWHPRIPGGTTQLGELNAGETKRVTLQLGVNDLPKVE